MDPPTSLPPLLQPQQSLDVVDLPVNDFELATCLSVLDKLASTPGWQQAPALRAFRKRLFTFATFPDGILSAVVSKTKSKKRKMKTLMAAQDRKLLNSCTLTASRLKALASPSTFPQKEQQEHQQQLPRIPDGPASQVDINQAKISPLSEDSKPLPVTPEKTYLTFFPHTDPTEMPEVHTVHNEEVEDELTNVAFRRLRCYVCKRPYHLVHQFYHLLCLECGDFNLLKRSQTGDLAGKVALVTGGRVKIGFHCALKLLRAGALVLVTTRFPQDSLLRFSKEPDFASWSERLRIHALDFRDIAGVEQFAAHLTRTLPRLDILINNACQTIHRPPTYYQQLVANETQPLLVQGDHSKLICKHPLPQQQQQHQQEVAAQSLLPLVPEDDPTLNAEIAQYFPANAMDAQGQQLDLRPANSWTLRLGQVSTPELLEVFSINACAPFILNGKLRPLMAASGTPSEPKFIVNVSAMEGCFNRMWKSTSHPHTNMAKAALNMMTRTSAADYAQEMIFMTSVDTGWINDEKPFEAAHRAFVDRGFQTPLDEIDAASRILDPVFVGLTSEGPLHSGIFLKDYTPHPW